LSAYWIPINFQGSAILAIAVPSALLTISGANHTAVLAVLASAVATLAMVVPPVAGAISDHFRRRGGIRRPFILLGAAVNVVGLFWMSHTSTLMPFTGGLLVATLGQSISLAAYQPLIPEVVERADWGLASGYQGISSLVGSVLGLAFASFLSPAAVFNWTAVLVVMGAVMVAATPEGKLQPEHEEAHVGNWFDFGVAFASRSFVNFGLTLLMTFVLYFFHDALGDQNPSASTGLFGGLALVGAVVTSFWMGQLSDRIARKNIVAAAGIPMAAAIYIFAAAPGMHWLGVIALLFGLGYGAFVSTGWALALDTVPQLRDAARDLGIWGLASGLPGVAAPTFGGWLLSRYSSAMAGYAMLFFIAATCFVIGSAIVLLIGSKQRARAR
jgi:MFS family permease